MNNDRSQPGTQFGTHFSAFSSGYRYFDRFAFEAVSQAQAAAQGNKIGKRALVLSLTDGLMQMRRTATNIIENVFESDVAALASWKSASHVEVPSKKKTPPPTP